MGLGKVGVCGGGLPDKTQKNIDVDAFARRGLSRLLLFLTDAHSLRRGEPVVYTSVSFAIYVSPSLRSVWVYVAFTGVFTSLNKKQKRIQKNR